MVFNFRQQRLQGKYAKNSILTEVLGWFFIDLSWVTRIGSMSGWFHRCPSGWFLHWMPITCQTLELAVEFTVSYEIRLHSVANLQNLIKTGHNVLRTITNHNQSILDRWTYQSRRIFFIESMKWWSLFCPPFFKHNNSFSDSPDHTKCRRRAYPRIIHFFLDVRNKVF